MRIQDISLLGIRAGLWLLGTVYLFIEAHEVIAREQITNITFFTVLFILANHQLSVSRNFLALKQFKTASRCYRASSLMFCASLLGVFDAALDYLIGAVTLPTSAITAWFSLFALGWAVNLVAVLLAIQSMETFLPLLFHSHRPDRSGADPHQ